MRNNPDDTAAKYNLAYAQKLLPKELANEQNTKKEKKSPHPSKYAKNLKKKADSLVAKYKFIDAFLLMQNGLKKDKTVMNYSDFIYKLDTIIKIDSLKN